MSVVIEETWVHSDGVCWGGGGGGEWVEREGMTAGGMCDGDGDGENETRSGERGHGKRC